MSKPNECDPMLPLDSDKCKCYECGEYFNSTYAFDKHRKFGKRCMHAAEMMSAGWQRTGTGHWLSPRKAPVAA